MSRGMNSAEKASDVILSNSDRDAESNSTTGGGSVRSHVGHSSGKRYFEVERVSTFETGNSSAAGITCTTTVTGFLGNLSQEYACWHSFAGGGSAQLFNNNVSKLSNAAYLNVGSVDRMVCAVNFDTLEVWFGFVPRRQSSTWMQELANPLTPLTPNYTLTAGTYHAALCPRRGHATNAAERNKLRFHGRWQDLQYFSRAFLDAGYLPWDTNAATVTRTVRDESGNLLANTEFDWAFFENATADSITWPVATGTATTNGSGVLSISIPATSLLNGETGSLLISTTAGTAGVQCRSWYMPVTVTV